MFEVPRLSLKIKSDVLDGLLYNSVYIINVIIKFKCKSALLDEKSVQEMEVGFDILQFVWSLGPGLSLCSVSSGTEEQESFLDICCQKLIRRTTDKSFKNVSYNVRPNPSPSPNPHADLQSAQARITHLLS